MAVRIRFDNTHNIIQPTFVLATRSGVKLGTFPVSEVRLVDTFNSYFDLSFKVDRYENGVECNLWSEIKDFKLLWCPEWDQWFEIYVETNEDTKTVKTVNAKSVGEAELSQINLYNIEINTEIDIDRDDYEPTVLYNEKNPNASLLNRIMEKTPHYTIKHVDASIANIQRTFTFDGTSIYDAFQEIAEEISCYFLIDSSSKPDGSIAREISVYDLESYCNECGERGSFLDKCSKCGSTNIKLGYGEDTTIFVSTENLAEDITYSTNTDSVKNCFKLEAGDELMTATVRSCNPNGSDYIWMISDEQKSDMSKELADKLTAYDEAYNKYQGDYNISLDSSVVSKYNALVEKYRKYMESLNTIPNPIVGYPALMNAYYDTIDFEVFLSSGLMPSPELQDTDAEKQAALLTSSALSPVAVTNIESCSASTASSAVLSMAKVVVDSRYQVKVKESTYTSRTWTGVFTVTNFADEEDTADSARVSVTVNGDYELFVRQKIDKTLDKQTDDANGIVALFKLDLSAFKEEIKKYCLNSLESFRDAAQAAVNILIEQGIADKDSWNDAGGNLYDNLYTPYYQKLSALEEEIKLRETEIETIAGKYDEDGGLVEDGLQTLIEDENRKIQLALNLENYLGHDLWLEFVAYRREDTYSNDNYISDGLDNNELFARAREFIETAQRDIFKSATLQHTISATLKNLLVMREFEPILDYFQVGNWIRVLANDVVHRLRLISYQIDFDDLTTLSIEFSDVTATSDGVSDVQSIISRASSMASSFDSVKHQAKQGAKSADEVTSWATKGLSLTKIKILDDAHDQDVTWGKNGILCREYLPITDSYDVRQLRIINRGLFLTDDNWETARAGIGNFKYFDPADGQEKESYGVIADTLIGNLILSERVGIYNKSSSITLDENGIVLTTEANKKSVFTIRKKTGSSTKDIIYMDSEGDAHFEGIINATGGKFTGDVVANSLKIGSLTVDEWFDQSAAPIKDSIQNVKNGTDGIFFYFPSTNVGKVELNRNVGLKITGKDGSCFRADNNAMGFFTSGGTASLYYEGGNLTVVGNITANTGRIGGTNGWVINSNSIYNGGASTLGASGGIFLGYEGISVSDAIIMKPDGSFIIRDNNRDGSTEEEKENYVFKIEPTRDLNGSVVYSLLIGEVQFNEGFMLGQVASNLPDVDRDVVGTSAGIYRITDYNDIDDLVDAENGDLCVLYAESATTILKGGYNTSGSLFLPVVQYSYSMDSRHNVSTPFFTFTNCWWNVSGISGENISSIYACVGTGKSAAGACGLFVPFNISKSGNAAIKSMKVTFKYVTRPAGYSSAHTYSGDPKALTVALLDSDGVQIAKTTFKAGTSTKNPTERDGKVTLKVTNTGGFAIGDYYLVFYSRTTKTLVWIKQETIAITSTPTTASNYGLYLKTKDTWQKLNASIG